MPNWELRDSQFLSLCERGQFLKAMLQQVINSEQGNYLKIEQIDQILTTIINLESRRLVAERLSLAEILCIFSNILAKSSTGDQFQTILVEIQRL